MGKYPPDPFRFKVVADPVHREIGLSQLEVALVDTPSFQRLRRLKQLGLASYVYPGATHARFAHSLGVFYIIGRAVHALRRRDIFSEHEERLLRAAALLHDIGHYPYSHLVEFLDRDPDRAVFLADKKATGKRTPYPDHETLGEFILRHRDDIKAALESAKVDPIEVAEIVRGRHSTQKYNQLVHSTLDADRLDYLPRDAISTGVPFGQVDVHYLLSNLTVDDEDRLVLNAKAATAAEHFILARYFMFRAVYQHKTVFGFEAMMRKALKTLRGSGDLWPDGDTIKEMVVDKSKFLEFDDGAVDRLVAKHADADGPTGTICAALRDRRPPELIKEVVSLTGEGTPQSEEFTRFHTRRKDHLSALAEKTGIPLELWLWEDPKPISFEKLGPFVALDEASSLSPGDMGELLRVGNLEGGSHPLLQDQRSLVYHLSRLRFQTARLYAISNDLGKVETAKREVDAWLDP